jgi:DNA-binding CsgD family transcriptional regulator
MTSPKPDLREPPVHIMLLDGRGVILNVQSQGRHPARHNEGAISGYAVGDSYLDHCKEDAHRSEVLALLRRKRGLISFVFPSQVQKLKHWFVVVGVPASTDADSGAVLMHIDISAWVPSRGEDDDMARKWQTPETLNPALIQETISKALVKQFGPMSASLMRTERPHPDIDSLSPRQREVLLLVAAGKSNQEIADELSCSLNTVKRHVTAVLQKLHLPNRTRAAMLANQLNLDSRNFK